MNWINFARVSAIFAVVILHVSVTSITEMPIGSSEWWAGNLYDSVVRWCVPIFIMISGALLLNEHRAESNASFYRKRFQKILIPTLFWSSVFILWRFVKAKVSHSPVETDALVVDLISGKPYYHLWFLFMILGLYLFTPFLRVLVAKTSRENLWLFSLMGLALAMINPLSTFLIPSSNATLFTLFLEFIPYYLLGYLISSSESKLPQSFVLSVFVISVSITAYAFYAVGTTLNIAQGSYFYNYLSLSVVPMSLSVFMLFRQARVLPEIYQGWISKLAGLSFGVYLIHPLPLEIIRYLGLKPELNWPYLSIPLVAIATFALSLLAAWTLQRLPLFHRVV